MNKQAHKERSMVARRTSKIEKLANLLGLDGSEYAKANPIAPHSGGKPVTVQDIVSQVEKEVSTIIREAKDSINPPIAAFRYSPEDGYTKAVSFTSYDHKEERTFYFREDDEPPECLNFNEGLKSVCPVDIDDPQIVKFKDAFYANDLYSERSQNYDSALRFVLFPIKHSEVWKLYKHHEEHLFSERNIVVRLAEQVVLSSGISVASKKFKVYVDKYVLSIFCSKDRGRIVKKAIYQILKKAIVSLRARIAKFYGFEKSITPLLYYTYPKEEEDSVNILSWPLHFQIV